MNKHKSEATKPILGSERASMLLMYVEEIGALAHNGLLFSKDPFDIDRYNRLSSIVEKMIELSSYLSSEEVCKLLVQDGHYSTPKIDVRGVVLIEDTVLLVKERSDQLWTLPGGWCEVNESPAEAVEKEIYEETGLNVKATKLLALFDKHKHDHPVSIPHAYKCFFLCKYTGGSLQNGTTETLSAEFWSLKSLPQLSRHRVTEKQIRHVVSIARDPALHAAFD